MLLHHCLLHFLSVLSAFKRWRLAIRFSRFSFNSIYRWWRTYLRCWWLKIDVDGKLPVWRRPSPVWNLSSESEVLSQQVNNSSDHCKSCPSRHLLIAGVILAGKSKHIKNNQEHYHFVTFCLAGAVIRWWAGRLEWSSSWRISTLPMRTMAFSLPDFLSLSYPDGFCSYFQ